MNNFLTILLKPRAWLAKALLVSVVVIFLLLDFLAYLQPVKAFLDSEALAFHVGDMRFSVYLLAKALLTVVVLIWLAGLLSDFIANKIKSIKDVKNSNKALLIKSLQIFIYFIAFIVGLDIIGIDLKTLTIFSGAVGIGIGFGLQKVTSNFISGLILLFEGSVEHDDLIELADGTSGLVKHSSARYTLVETYDGKEIMIPNEDFITNRVTNWTYSNTKGRIEIKVGVSYDCDIEQARELMLTAAREHPRTLSDPEPVCYLREFADSAVNFVLFFWIADVTDRRLESQSDVMRAIWRKFKEHHIAIPYPQRELYIKNPESLRA